MMMGRLFPRQVSLVCGDRSNVPEHVIALGI